jgi:hypothetical protein
MWSFIGWSRLGLGAISAAAQYVVNRRTLIGYHEWKKMYIASAKQVVQIDVAYA